MSKAWRTVARPNRLGMLLLPEGGAAPHLDALETYCAALYGYERRALALHERTHDLVRARFVLWRVLIQAGWIASEIGRHYGWDHATVTHGLQCGEAESAIRDQAAAAYHWLCGMPDAHGLALLIGKPWDARGMPVACLLAYLRWLLCDARWTAAAYSGLCLLATDRRAYSRVTEWLTASDRRGHAWRIDQHMRQLGLVKTC